MEDSGVGSAYHKAFVMSNRKTSISKNLQTFVPHMPDIVKPSYLRYKVWALYMQNSGLSSLCMHEIAHKNVAKIGENLP